MNNIESSAYTIVEIKARSDGHDKIRRILKENNAEFKGTDQQTDTYFNVGKGRLKLREGKIENHLIFYERKNEAGPKQSDVILYKPAPGSSLKEILTNSLGILAVVNKTREIYFIDNVKVHLDKIDKLGIFIEIEAIDKERNKSRNELLEQCRYFMNLFGVSEKNLIDVSYSDLLMNADV